VAVVALTEGAGHEEVETGEGFAEVEVEEIVADSVEVEVEETAVVLVEDVEVEVVTGKFTLGPAFTFHGSSLK
jgi:hypothetical protein